MNLYEKLALIASAAVLTVLTAVGVVANRAVPETAAPANVTDAVMNPAQNTDSGSESVLPPPFAEEPDEEVLEYLPARPGFMHPGYVDGNDPVGTTADDTQSEPPMTEDAVTSAAPSSTDSVDSSAAPETEELPEVTPPSVSPEPAPVTTQKPQTTDPKPAPVPQTGSLRKDMIEIAKSQVGVKESGRNNVKYNTWFYGHTVREPKPGVTRYGWCVAFLSWCADQAGIDTSIIPKTASVRSLHDFFDDQGLYYTRKNYTPKAGDIVFFKLSHVGLVVSVDGDQIRVVEGNYSDGVALTTYDISSTKLTGYGSPRY